MKSKTLTILITIVALFIGFLTGIFVDYPYVNNDGLSGTIGKVNNYRNVKATEEDIELRNELLADSAMQNSVKNYMTFYYSRALQFGEDIDFSVKEARSNEAFKNTNELSIIALENFRDFLGKARKNLLRAVTACQSVEKINPAALRHSIARGNNVIVQMNYRNNTVLDFISALNTFIQEGIGSNEGLKRAHDLLLYDEIAYSVFKKDKSLLQFFEKRKLYDTHFTPPVQIDLQQIVINDVKTVDSGCISDMENLGQVYDPDGPGIQAVIQDMEKLNVYDVEFLGYYINDSEQPDFIKSFETLGDNFFQDAGKVTGFLDNERLSSCASCH